MEANGNVSLRMNSILLKNSTRMLTMMILGYCWYVLHAFSYISKYLAVMFCDTIHYFASRKCCIQLSFTTFTSGLFCQYFIEADFP